MPSSSIRREIAGGLGRAMDVANTIVFDVPSLTVLADAGVAMHASATVAATIVRRADDVVGMAGSSWSDGVVGEEDPPERSEVGRLRRGHAWLTAVSAGFPA
jgi:hypothetical protein